MLLLHLLPLPGCLLLMVLFLARLLALAPLSPRTLESVLQRAVQPHQGCSAQCAFLHSSQVNGAELGRVHAEPHHRQAVEEAGAQHEQRALSLVRAPLHQGAQQVAAKGQAVKGNGDTAHKANGNGAPHAWRDVLTLRVGQKGRRER